MVGTLFEVVSNEFESFKHVFEEIFTVWLSWENPFSEKTVFL